MLVMTSIHTRKRYKKKCVPEKSILNKKLSTKIYSDCNAMLKNIKREINC